MNRIFFGSLLLHAWGLGIHLSVGNEE